MFSGWQVGLGPHNKLSCDILSSKILRTNPVRVKGEARRQILMSVHLSTCFRPSFSVNSTFINQMFYWLRLNSQIFHLTLGGLLLLFAPSLSSTFKRFKIITITTCTRRPCWEEPMRSTWALGWMRMDSGCQSCALGMGESVCTGVHGSEPVAAWNSALTTCSLWNLGLVTLSALFFFLKWTDWTEWVFFKVCVCFQTKACLLQGTLKRFSKASSVLTYFERFKCMLFFALIKNTLSS